MICTIPLILILGWVYPHSFFRDYFPRFLFLLFYAKILYDVFTKERRFLTDYIEQPGLISLFYLNQFARPKKISVVKQEIGKVGLEKKRGFWRPYDILTVSNNQDSLKFEFKDVRFRQLEKDLQNEK